MMAGTAGFDPDHRWRELLEERHHLVTPELFAQNRDTGVIYPMKLKNVLRRIHSNSANLVHGRSPLFEINTRPHSGTLDAAGGRPHQQTRRYTRSRVDAARADDGTLIFSLVVRTWIDALARRRSCPGMIVRTWPFWRWPDRSRSASWPAGTR